MISITVSKPRETILPLSDWIFKLNLSTIYQVFKAIDTKFEQNFQKRNFKWIIVNIEQATDLYDSHIDSYYIVIDYSNVTIPRHSQQARPVIINKITF